MKKRFASLICSLFFCLNVFCQENKTYYTAQIDSVQQVIDNISTKDTLRVIALNHLARLCIYDYQYEKGLKVAIEARESAKHLGYLPGEGLYLRILDILHYDDRMETPYHLLAHWYFADIKRAEPKISIKTSSKQDISKRNSAIEKAALSFEQSGYSEMAAHLYHLSAFNDFSGNKFEEALKKTEKAKQIFTNLKLDIPLVASKILKAKILKQLGKNDEVRNEELQMVKIGEAHNYEIERALLFHLISVYFYHNTQQIDVSLDYSLKSIHILENLNENYLLARMYYYAGVGIHFSGSTPTSIEYIDKAFALIRSENIHDLYMYGFYNFYASRLIEGGQYEKAEKILEIGKPFNNYSTYGLDHQGMILMAKGKYIEALDKFYEITALRGLKRGEPDNSSWINYHIAFCLSQLGKINESNRFAIAAFQQDASRVNRDSEVLKTCLLLYENYDKLGLSKKALEYLKIYAESLQKAKELDISNRATKMELQEVITKSDREKSKLEQEKILQEKANQNQRWWLFSIAAGLFSSLLVLYLLFRNNKNKQKANELLKQQKEEINIQKNKAEEALSTLKSTQSQLIQSEKMASLGELTAGIAHEIQNPLNFVNNFSEVSNELVEELKSEKAKGKSERDEALEDEILNDISQNLEKINHHGKRAAEIVKGMLQHSRTSSGHKEPTDINALADEYLRLAYHGLRAKDKSFNADFKTDLDETLPKINVIPQDIGRVLLNLINNAFYAAPLPPKGGFKDPNYVHKPTVIIKTSFIPPSGGQRGACLVSVIDNGPGIPSEIKDKIFQPFFTTKPTGQGTGLGLSLSYDIVKAHGGEVKVKTKEGEGSEFIITLPVT
jgi:two-component system, NtrC family, sensor kinase